jgi:hypothetical protein
MKNPKRSPRSENALPVPSYAAVASIIAPANTPPWLKEYLENWGPSVRLDFGVSVKQPTKATMKRRLVNVSKAAALLDRELGDAATREFLERAGSVRIDSLGSLHRALQILAQHAEIAAGSPILSTEAGKTRSGRGRAIPPGALCPKDILCGGNRRSLGIFAWRISKTSE